MSSLKKACSMMNRHGSEIAKNGATVCKKFWDIAGEFFEQKAYLRPSP